MKNIRYLIIFVGLVSLEFCKKESIKEANIEQPIAKIQYIKGVVKIEREGNVIEGKINDFLQKNDILYTEKDSVVDIIIRQKGIIRITDNTKIKINFITSENIEIFQDKGSIITHLRKLKESENYSIVTPTSVAAVRGTSFITKIINENQTNFALIEGRIEIKNKKGETIILEQAGEIIVERDKELSKKKILPLSKESLQILKEIASQDKGNIQEYASFVTEIKNSSMYKYIATDTNYEEKVEEFKKLPEKKVIEKIKSSEENVIQRNIKKDPLKIPSEKDFEK